MFLISSKQKYLESLIEANKTLTKTTELILNRAKTDKAEIGSASYGYMEIIGHILYGYMWAKILATVLNSDSGKYAEDYLDGLKQTARFYFEKILPRYKSLAEEVASGSESLMVMNAEQF